MELTPWRLGKSQSGKPHVYYQAGGDREATGGDVWAAARIAELEQECNSLRKYLATSKADCPYCGLAAADMNKCASGFPGCGRADDLMLDCGE